MAKKRQTTGLPKPASSKPVTPVEKETEKPTGISALVNRGAGTQGYRSQAEQEAVVQRYVILATVVAVAVIVVLLVGAFVIDGLIRPNEPVANVNGENISVATFQQRVKMEHSILNVQFSSALSQFAQFTGGDLSQAYQQIIQQDPYRTWSSELQFPDTLASRVLNELIDERLIEAAAAELGVTVTDEDIEAEINRFIGYNPDDVLTIGVDPTETPEPTITPTLFVSPTPAPTDTPTPEPTEEVVETEEAVATEEVAGSDLNVTAVPTELEPTLSVTEVQGQFFDFRDRFFDRVQRDAGVNRETVRDYFRMRALREKVAEAISGDTSTATHVNTRHILVATETQAQDVLDALAAGESFAALARSMSTDTGSGSQGGELGWSPVFQFVDEFAEAVLTAEIGAIVGPVESEFGYHIIQVRAREDRELDESQVSQLQARNFERWLEEQRTAEGTQFETYSRWTERVPRLEFMLDPL